MISTGWLLIQISIFASRKVMAAGGRRAIYADAEQLHRLRRLRDSPRGWPQPYPTELITPEPKIEQTTTPAP